VGGGEVEKMLIIIISEPDRKKVTTGWRQFHSEELHQILLW
jgi:hypothetical protein